MTQQLIAMQHHQRVGARRIQCSHTSSRKPWFYYWNPCNGLAPVLIEGPLLFFRVQIFSGIGALVFLLAMEQGR